MHAHAHNFLNRFLATPLFLLLYGKPGNANFFQASSLLSLAKVLRIEKMLHAHAYIAHCVNISMGKIKFYSMKAISNTLIQRHNGTFQYGKENHSGISFPGQFKKIFKEFF